MTALQAGALILAIKAALITGHVSFPLGPGAPGSHTDASGFGVATTEIAGSSFTYDRTSRLWVVRQPTADTVARLFTGPREATRLLGSGFGAGRRREVGPQFAEANMRLPSDKPTVLRLSSAGGQGFAYLEEVEPGLFRKKQVEEVPGYVVTMEPTQAPAPADAGVAPIVVLAYQELSGGTWQADLGAYIGRPSVDRREVSVAPILKVGESVLMVWEAPVQERPAGPGAIQPGDTVDLLFMLPDEPPDYGTQPIRHIRPTLAVLLEFTTADAQARAAAAPTAGGLRSGGFRRSDESPIPPQPTPVPPVPFVGGMPSPVPPVPFVGGMPSPSLRWDMAPLDRELLEARVRESDAQVAAARIRLQQAKRKADEADAQVEAAQITQSERLDREDALSLAQADLARVTAEADAQRILLRRAIQAGPQASLTVVAMGEVKQPGVYVLPLNSTLLDLLLKAGGPTDKADLAHAALMRTAAEDRAAREVDLSAWKPGPGGQLAGGGASGKHPLGGAAELRSGDVLVVRATAPDAARFACLGNLRNLAKAALKWAEAHGETLPPALHWSTEIGPYMELGERLQELDPFRCPGAPALACGYSYNLDVAGKRLSEIQDPVGTVLFYESTLGVMDAADSGQSQPRPGRHGGANNKAYVDGHASGRALQPEKLPPAVLAPAPRQTK